MLKERLVYVTLWPIHKVLDLLIWGVTKLEKHLNRKDA